RSGRTIFFAGFFMGLGLLMKQPGAAFGAFRLLYLLRTKRWRAGAWREPVRGALCYVAGAVLPYGITCLVLWRAGVFAKFWFWTVNYALQYGTNVAGARLYFLNNVPQTIHSAIAMWILAGAGLSALFWNPGFWNTKKRARADFLVGLFLFSGVAV